MNHLHVAIVGLGLLAVTLSACSEKTPPAPKADQEQAVKGNTDFAFDLYARLRDKEGNLFFSPYSLSSALAMTYAGANGDTSDEIAKTLHFSLSRERLPAALAAVDWTVTAGGKPTGYQIATANALWGQKGHPFLAAFLTLLQESYGAGLHEVDFQKATEEARETINRWVEKQTHDKIKDLIGAGVLNPDTRLVLTNAIYFKGEWAAPFNKKATLDEDFQLTAGKKIRTPFMHQKGHFQLAEDDVVRVLEMPYDGDAMSMVLILPKRIDGLANIEKSLSPAQFRKWVQSLKNQEVQVALPKFKITAQFQLNAELAAMGMPKAFSREADFSRMDGSHELSISALIHKAFVDVNEEGTEAAAATGVVIALRAAPAREIPVFRADHPFLFAIRDNVSGSLLFLGRIAHPEK